MKKNNYPFLELIKYIVYLLVAISVVMTGEYSMNIITKFIICIMLYILNTQIRMYFLYAKKYAVIISLFIDLVLISVIYYSFGGFVFIYYFISVLDAALMLPKAYAYVVISVLYAAVIFQSGKPIYGKMQNYTLINVIFNTVIVVIFGALGRYIEEERERKSEAQDLYDKLRISEENLKDTFEKLQQYSNTVEELTILRERNRISREIHDSVGHTLSTLLIQLQAIPYVMKNDQNEGGKMVDNLVHFTKNGIENVRRAVKELKPTDFDSYQGIFALQELTSNFEKLSGVVVRFIVSSEKWALSGDQSFTLYRIIQESLNNSLKHGNASSVTISLQFLEDKLYLHIKDDGKGCLKIKKGFGLNGIEQRVKSLGGEVDVHAEKGFEINISIPKIESLIK
ncbi:MAG: sensor histidine kinase [Clostridium sp.]|uniref:sensor histidine kinase n=1 Tax=Clostridium sp. TaxID=1506 RepID=UPI003D6D5C96